jgi:hypothetical protein
MQASWHPVATTLLHKHPHQQAAMPNDCCPAQQAAGIPTISPNGPAINLVNKQERYLLFT